MRRKIDIEGRSMTYIGKLAEVEGADPTAGAAVWKYVSADNLGSVRALRADFAISWVNILRPS